MTSAPGTKKNTAARTHKLMDEVPLCPAAAIQRGPRTVAMLNNSTSQKPIVLRNCDLESSEVGAAIVIVSPDVREGRHGALGNHKWMGYTRILKPHSRECHLNPFGPRTCYLAESGSRVECRMSLLFPSALKKRV